MPQLAPRFVRQRGGDLKAIRALSFRSYEREEGIIGAYTRLGDLLVQSGLVTAEDVERALVRSSQHGGRLGENLVALGLLEQRTIDSFLHRIPPEPADLAATCIDENDLMALLIKLIFTERLSTVRQYVEAIKLPLLIVNDLVAMAIDRHLIHALGTRKSDSILDMSYAFTEEGRRWAAEALERSHYVGPAPITIDEFNKQVRLQKPGIERVSLDLLKNALTGLTVSRSLMEQAGPALNSGRAILLYGPPGNGKTTVALSFANVFRDVIYLPYAIIIEGQIIRFYDPAIHHAVEDTVPDDNSFIRTDTRDMRWVPCKRPFIVTGGELTLDMLDLRYDAIGHFYEAPVHMKALGGCFLIDDFGRQLVSPSDLLNRWIVPLESRVDYLKLHTGKSFSVPFEEMIIFSTNLEPEDLMDPAFLRRLPYKIEVGAPGLKAYKEIFESECKRHRIAFDDSTFQYVVSLLKEKELEFAAYQPRFLVDQVVATCRFMGEPPHFNQRYIEYAIGNLHVRRSGKDKSTRTLAKS